MGPIIGVWHVTLLQDQGLHYQRKTLLLLKVPLKRMEQLPLRLHLTMLGHNRGLATLKLMSFFSTSATQKHGATTLMTAAPFRTSQ